jgi:uncharacterized membrane protein
MLQHINLFKIKYSLFITLIILAPLSKYPSIAVPLFNFTSFRIGLYQILAIVFIALFFWNKDYSFLKKNKPVLIGIGLILLSIVLGGFFAIDKSRWLLLGSSVIMLLLLLVSVWSFIFNGGKKINWLQVFRYALIASLVFSLLAIVQFVVNSFTTEDFGILCKNCVSTVFGFPRVNLFSAEPQFLANSLLPFVFISFYSFVKNKSKLSVLSLILSSLTIGLTFSRGAFIALVIGAMLFFIFSYKNINLKHLVMGSLLILSSLLLAIVLLVASASLKYRSVENITYDTTNTVLQQLSLGLLALPEKQEGVVSDTASSPPQPPSEDSTDTFESPGLIEESGNERIEAAKLALQAWSNNLKNILIGTGLGNLGPFVVHNINSAAPANLTVYIYFVLVLSEMGLVGLFGFLLILFSPAVILVAKYKLNQPFFMPVIIALTGAFAVQYLFFGSYINVVYIWLWLGISAGLASLSQKQLSNLIK